MDIAGDLGESDLEETVSVSPNSLGDERGLRCRGGMEALEPVRTLSLTSGTRSLPSTPGGRIERSRLEAARSDEGTRRGNDSAYLLISAVLSGSDDVEGARRGMEASPRVERTTRFFLICGVGVGAVRL